MKRAFKVLLFAAAASFLFAGCGRIWDFNPVVFTIKVVDAEGNDLLNPDLEGGIDASGIVAQYEGEEYKCVVPTRYYMPHFEGLKLENYGDHGYMLTFGEFAGEREFDNAELVLIWPDGSSDVITYDRRVRNKLNGGIKVKQEWFLNGKSVSEEHGEIIEIVK